MDTLTLFGFVSVGFTLLCYTLEERGADWTLGFAFGCLLSAAYAILQGAWPFGAMELLWTVIAARRWRRRRHRPAGGTDCLTRRSRALN